MRRIKNIVFDQNKIHLYNMSKKRYITTEFWRDSFIDDLDPIEKLLFLYLICNPATNLCGIYQIPLRIIASDTGIDSRALENIFAKFAEKKRAYYLEGWVILPNAPKHQQVENSKIVEGIRRELNEEVSKEILEKLDTLSIPYIYTIDAPVKYSIGISKSISKVKYSVEDQKLAQTLYDLIKESNPAWYVTPNWDQWSEDIRKIRELDKRTSEQIEFIIRWSQGDDFWRKNILSPSKLRKQFNTLVVQAKAKSQPKVML